MNITPAQKQKIEWVINAFETGKASGDYAAIAMLVDGKVGGKLYKQITYGRSQTTEFGNLPLLLQMYVNTGGIYSNDFRPYMSKLGKLPSLCTNKAFVDLLKTAAKDPKMQECQDSFFDNNYFKPAKEWCEGNGFTLALSLLVVYDSYIHSGKIRQDIRLAFEEKTPINGGDEKEWIANYISARENWLKNSKNPKVRTTVYRTECLFKQVENDNWDLSKKLVANGCKI